MGKFFHRKVLPKASYCNLTCFESGHGKLEVCYESVQDVIKAKRLLSLLSKKLGAQNEENRFTIRSALTPELEQRIVEEEAEEQERIEAAVKEWMSETDESSEDEDKDGESFKAREILEELQAETEKAEREKQEAIAKRKEAEKEKAVKTQEKSKRSIYVKNIPSDWSPEFAENVLRQVFPSAEDFNIKHQAEDPTGPKYAYVRFESESSRDESFSKSQNKMGVMSAHKCPLPNDGSVIPRKSNRRKRGKKRSATEKLILKEQEDLKKKLRKEDPSQHEGSSTAGQQRPLQWPHQQPPQVFNRPPPAPSFNRQPHFLQQPFKQPFNPQAYNHPTKVYNHPSQSWSHQRFGTPPAHLQQQTTHYQHLRHAGRMPDFSSR